MQVSLHLCTPALRVALLRNSLYGCVCHESAEHVTSVAGRLEDPAAQSKLEGRERDDSLCHLIDYVQSQHIDLE